MSITHNPVDFVLENIIGSRTIIRLINSTCDWTKIIAGKTHFTFLGCVLDTEALSKNWLKPLDNEIYVIKGIKGILTFKNKCWDRFNREKIETIFKAIQHGTKTVADSAAGLRFLAAFGLVILSPYGKSLSLTKNVFAVTAGIAEIVCRVHDLWLVVNQPVKPEQEQRQLNARWVGDVLMIAIQILSIQLNFFGGLNAVFKDSMSAEDRVPGIVFSILGTGASLISLVYSAAGYFGSSE